MVDAKGIRSMEKDREKERKNVYGRGRQIERKRGRQTRESNRKRKAVKQLFVLF